MRSTADRQEGFTLVELLIALTLFAIGLLGIAGLQSGAIRSNRVAHGGTVAISLAQSVLEEILAQDGKDPLFAHTGRGTWPLPAEAAGRYAAAWEVAADDPASGLSRVRVTITGQPSRPTSLTGFKRVGR